MPLITRESVDQVRTGVDLVELIRTRVELSRRGGRWWGCCPFHQEKTPSFCLLPDNSRYYCFGCGESGDALDWAQVQEGAANFSEAVEWLADRFSIELTYETTSPEDDARRRASERRLQLLERAAAFYGEYLWRAPEAAEARDYLLGRGFSEDLLRGFRVGYAPGQGMVLSERAAAGGFMPQELTDAGLARQRGGGDFFRSRIIFPIADARGRVQGFGGRTLDPEARAKYINSPEGPSFRKRHLLFGLAEARAAAGRGGYVVVAEGYTDVLGLVRAGEEAAVACMGTSLTADQLRLAARHAREVRVCFDGDAAGQKAAWRSFEAAKGIPLRMSAVVLPEGRDPGDLSADAEGREALQFAVADAASLLVSLVQSKSQAARSAHERAEALDEITQLLQETPDSVEKDEAIRMAAGNLQLARTTGERFNEAARYRGEGEALAAPTEEPAAPQDTARSARERGVLSLALARPESARRYLADVDIDGSFSSPELAAAARLLAEGADPAGWPEELSGIADRLRAEAPIEASEAELREAVYRLQEDVIWRRLAQLRERGDEEERIRVQQTLNQLRDALREGEA